MNNRKHGIWLLLGMVAVYFIALFVIVNTAGAATYYYPLKIPTSNYGETFDSLIVITYTDGVTVRDSLLFESFPVEDSIALNTDTAYMLCAQYSYSGNDGLSSPGCATIGARAVTTATDTVNIKTLATNNPGLFYGPSAAGVGSDTVIIYALDTSGITDAVVSGVKLTLVLPDLSELPVYTNTNGYVQYTVDTGTGYTVRGRLSNYRFIDTTFNITDNIDSMAIHGYDLASTIPSPSGDSTCTAFGVLRNIADSTPKFAKVRIWLPEKVIDSCSFVTIVQYETTVEADENGVWYANLIRSSCFGDVEYEAELTWKGYSKRTQFLVPDQDSLRVIFR